MRVEEIPEDMMPIAQEYRQKLLEAVSDFDDDIMMAYLEGEEIPVDKIRAAIRMATVQVRWCLLLAVHLTETRAFRNFLMPS